MKKKVFLGIFIVLIIEVIGSIGYIYYKLSEKRSFPALLEIKSNIPLRESLSALPVAKEVAFKLYLKYLKNGGKKIKAGYYSLDKKMSIVEFIDLLEKGKDKTFKLTVPEGYTIAQIVNLLVADKRIDKDKFYEELKNTKGFPYKTPDNNFEGYFYPETYFINDNATERMIIDTFLNEFLKRFPARNYPNKDEFYEKLIMASILEREAKLDKEKPLMASVFYNRLKINMKLASDATVNFVYNYEIKEMKYKHLKIDSPYNTYQNYGLPPAPISNPTTVSVKAAYNPADTDYLFFVAKGDGGHFFSKYYNEHLKFQNDNNRKGDSQKN